MEKVTKLSDRRQEISLLDKIAAYQKLIRTPGLDPYARTVAMFICDKTVGFGKVSDTIPVGQIMKGTNIGRTRLFETLDFLRGQGIISTEQNGRGLHVTFMRSWEPEILPIPKRLQDKTSPPDEHQKSATRTSEVRHADPSTGTLPTGILSTGLTTDMGSPAGPPPATRQKPVQKEKTPEQKISEIVNRKPDLKPTDYAGHFVAGMRASGLTKIAIIDPTRKEKARLKDAASKFEHPDINFAGLCKWAAQNWNIVVERKMGWMTKRKAPRSPEIDFFIWRIADFVAVFNDFRAAGQIVSDKKTKAQEMNLRGDWWKGAKPKVREIKPRTNTMTNEELGLEPVQFDLVPDWKEPT